MIIGSDPDYDTNESTGSVVLEDKPEIKEPPLYQVVLINDDYCLLYTSPSPRDQA